MTSYWERVSIWAGLIELKVNNYPGNRGIWEKPEYIGRGCCVVSWPERECDGRTDEEEKCKDVHLELATACSSECVRKRKSLPKSQRSRQMSLAIYAKKNQRSE